MMAALPYIQLYVADYLADTAHLTAAQHGAYLLLIMNYWQRGQALNNSNERLANVAHMSNEEWTANKQILQEFFEVDGDTWSHHRIEVDLAAVHSKSTKASNAGKASAEQRSNKRSAVVQQTLNHTDTDTDTDTDKKKSRGSPATRISDDWVVTAEAGNWALEQNTNWTNEDVLRIGIKFKNHWLAKSGKDARKNNWNATWQNWIFNEIEYAKK